jgi:hypothetical protein
MFVTETRICIPTAMVRSTRVFQGRVPGSSSTPGVQPLLERGRVLDDAENATIFTNGWTYSVSTCGSEFDVALPRPSLVVGSLTGNVNDRCTTGVEGADNVGLLIAVTP